MKSKEAKQSKQGQVSTPGESPKDVNQNTYTEEETNLAAKHKVEPKLVRLLNEIVEEHTAEPKQAESEEVEGTETEGPETDEESEFQEQRFQNCVGDIQKAVSQYPVECRPKVLAVALEQATKGKGAAEKIVEIGQEIRRTCDSLLDPKAKATLALLSELSSLSGITNVGVDFATDILHSAFGQKDVKQALEQFPDDNDVAFLSYVFGLAHSVTKAEGKLFQKIATTAKEEETATTTQPQATKTEDDAEAGPNTGIKALDDFLERIGLEAQAIAYGALRLVCVSDATGKKMRDYLRRQAAVLNDPKKVDDLMMDGQVLADIKWFLGFVRGAEIGLEEC